MSRLQHHLHNPLSTVNLSEQPAPALRRHTLPHLSRSTLPAAALTPSNPYIMAGKPPPQAMPYTFVPESTAAPRQLAPQSSHHAVWLLCRQKIRHLKAPTSSTFPVRPNPPVIKPLQHRFFRCSIRVLVLRTGVCLAVCFLGGLWRARRVSLLRRPLGVLPLPSSAVVFVFGRDSSSCIVPGRFVGLLANTTKCGCLWDGGAVSIRGQEGRGGRLPRFELD